MTDIDRLVSRADKARQRNQFLRETPGTGYHDDDRDHRGRLRAPQHNGKPPVEQHVVAFNSDEDVWFVGADAKKVHDALQRDLAAVKAADPADLGGSDRKRLKYLPRLRLEKQGGADLLVIPRGVWDDVLGSVYRQGLGITGLDREGEA